LIWTEKEWVTEDLIARRDMELWNRNTANKQKAAACSTEIQSQTIRSGKQALEMKTGALALRSGKLTKIV
jgi:hypothetical protein